MNDKFDIKKDVGIPEDLDGNPISPEEAQRVHQALKTGSMSIEITPGVAEKLSELGLSADDLKEVLLEANKKALS
jgi:hypothetical protein